MKKNNTKIIILVSIVILLLLAVFYFVVYKNWQNKNKANLADTPQVDGIALAPKYDVIGVADIGSSVIQSPITVTERITEQPVKPATKVKVATAFDLQDVAIASTSIRALPILLNQTTSLRP